jgi:hypothetical protein
MLGRREAAVALVAMLAIAAAHILAVQQPADAPGAAPAYWCPMHRDVRGAAGDKCPRCGMALVAAAPGDYEPYVLDFDVTPRLLRPGQKARLHFSVHDPHTGATVRHFEPVHERVLHLFIISRDLEYFAHEHPTLHADGSLDLAVQLPRRGAYQLIADFLPVGGTPQLLQKSLLTAGYTGSLTTVPQLAPDIAPKIVDGTRVMLTMPEPVAGREQLVTFDVWDEATGAVATDLQPYLGATGHLLLVSADLEIAFHSHPVAEISGLTGSPVVFQVLFPRAGTYRMWAQFQRRGTVLTAPFTVAVKDRP